jgi:hypothetical protein
MWTLSRQSNLSQRLLKTQDEERRRVARDLHDCTGQTLTALKMSVADLEKRLQEGHCTSGVLCDITALADQALHEIRTTSFLLHPPLLDEVGFSAAAQWYVEGFAQRSGIKARMDFATELERLPIAIETALFRVLQESLTNVHRHSGASEVEVRFLREANAAILEVRDYGRGIAQELLSRLGQSVRDSGVGLSGMCERLNELKGDLEITSANPGTRLRAIVPLFSHAVADTLPTHLLTAAPTNRAIYEHCRTFMTRAGKLPAFTRSALAALNRARRLPLNAGQWETVGVAAVLVIACWIGFMNRRPPSPSGVSGLRGSNALDQQISFAVAKRVVANLATKPQTGLREESGERKTSRTTQQRTLDRNIRVQYISEDVTVRYFPSEPAGSPPSAPNGSPGQSMRH